MYGHCIITAKRINKTSCKYHQRLFHHSLRLEAKVTFANIDGPEMTSN